MSARELSNQRIHEVDTLLSSYDRTVPQTDLKQLGALAKSVLSSIDIRDLGETTTQQLLAQLELVLSTLQVRKSGEINVSVREQTDHYVIESCMDDQPFIVSAVRALCASEGLEARTSLNAVARLRRDKAGRLLALGSGTKESVMRMEVRAGPDGVAPGLDGRVRERLSLARGMVRDFPSMKRHIQSLADDFLAASTMVDPTEAMMARETEGLLRWLCEENYVLFSVEEYGSEGEEPTLLGRARVNPPVRDAATIDRASRGSGRRVRYTRSAEESPVHRAGKPGQFVFTRVDRRGQPIGAMALDGLFTYKALHTPPEEIPYLRMLLRDMLADRDVDPDSHRGKSITNAFNSLPLEYLLTESREQVWELTDRVLRAEEAGGSDVHIKVGEDRRFAFVFVTLPRWQFSEELRLELQEVVLEEFEASYADYGVYIDRYENAIVHFYITGLGTLPVVDTERLRERVHGLAKGWNERLQEALASLGGEQGETQGQGESLFDVYVDAFNEEHRRRAAGERLADDVRCLENLRAGYPLDCDLFISRTGDHPGSLNLRIFTREALSLSAQLPVIDNLGFEVIDEYTRGVRIPHLPAIEMHTFRLGVRRELHRAVLGRRVEIRSALREVFARRMGDDSLNRLVVTTSMRAHDVEVIRAFVAYLHQLRSPFATPLIRRVLVSHPNVSQALVGSICARFEPGCPIDAETAEASLESELRAISDYTADRVLQAVAEVVRATRRTNAYVADVANGQALAFKIEATAVAHGPEPKPYREIFVFHPDFEGVHLRGGKVARGGLRFSDRLDDYRTEIHGLMATQMVKNVLIVPMGAKGGFALRRPPADRKKLRAAGDAYYQVFIRALLSVTDNVVDGRTVTPQGIRHTEGDDPYLVVAADKGTAHLSDTANKISMEHGFWLDDAFASGGSQGYDHKATGITARGAWEATKRNFRELGVDPERDVISAIGVGDMSGDVFGNGLLRSKTVRLLAAFNHLHVFIDPDPDPARSFTARESLFEAPGSTWMDYDSEALSTGGGVYPRRAKELELSAEARALLGFQADERVSGDEVIRAVMRLDVDLFWMGGIGTYVKSHDESHSDVGDKANDSVRIDARELRCRVFAEGANLAITDRGRVEFARAGGQGYTAFLDNSGGVDTSDHEVNIKILYAPGLASGKVSRDQRNGTLREVEDEICEMVLDNNRAQSRMVSYDVARSHVDPWRYSRAMRVLAAAVPFDPDAFAMPHEEELSSRARKGEGFYKCEAAVLGSHAKMLAYRELLSSDPLPESIVVQMVGAYFPTRVRDAVGDEMLRNHLLRRELATTMVVNRIVDNAGASFFPELTTVTGRPCRDVAVGYLRACDFGDIDALQRELYALEDKHNQATIYRAMEYVQSALEDATFELLGPVGLALEPAQLESARALLARIDEVLPEDRRADLETRCQHLVEGGLPAQLARRCLSLAYMRVILDAQRLASACGQPVEDMLITRLEVESTLRLPQLRAALGSMRFESPWDGPAVASLTRQLEFHVHKMARMVGADDVAGMLKRHGLHRVQGQIQELLRNEVTIASLVVLDSQLRRLLPPTTAIPRVRVAADADESSL